MSFSNDKLPVTIHRSQKSDGFCIYSYVWKELSFFGEKAVGVGELFAVRKSGFRIFREKLQSPHPFFWAGFVLSGDKSPIEWAQTPFWKNTTVLIVFSITIILLLIVFVRKRQRRGSDG